ncbi:unnamed protein product [Moneuplotes crassus]|uniref:Uncharacterized protein n=1 Tax=Euplotes crassus TaxID=5936 RepID=A0AAD2D2M5_EUPCR|nr:unnamed protein product [Moneuplotes crassus]
MLIEIKMLISILFMMQIKRMDVFYQGIVQILRTCTFKTQFCIARSKFIKFSKCFNVPSS